VEDELSAAAASPPEDDTWLIPPPSDIDARWGKSVVTPSMFTALVFRGV
jgi:hypothetical protein